MYTFIFSMTIVVGLCVKSIKFRWSLIFLSDRTILHIKEIERLVSTQYFCDRCDGLWVVSYIIQKLLLRGIFFFLITFFRNTLLKNSFWEIFFLKLYSRFFSWIFYTESFFCLKIFVEKFFFVKFFFMIFLNALFQECSLDENFFAIFFL